MRKKSKATINSLKQASLATVDEILQMPPAVQHSPPPPQENSAAATAGTGGGQQQQPIMAEQQPGMAQTPQMRLGEQPIHGPFSEAEQQAAAAAAATRHGIPLPSSSNTSSTASSAAVQADDQAPGGLSATGGGASKQPPPPTTTAAATSTTTTTAATTASSTSGVQGVIKPLPYKIAANKKLQQSLNRSERARQRAEKGEAEPAQEVADQPQQILEGGGSHLQEPREDVPQYHPPATEGGDENYNARAGHAEARGGQADNEPLDFDWGLEAEETRRRDTPMPSRDNSGLNTPTFVQQQQSSQEWLYSQERLAQEEEQQHEVEYLMTHEPISMEQQDEFGRRNVKIIKHQTAFESQIMKLNRALRFRESEERVRTLINSVQVIFETLKQTRIWVMQALPPHRAANDTYLEKYHNQYVVSKAHAESYLKVLIEEEEERCMAQYNALQRAAYERQLAEEATAAAQTASQLSKQNTIYMRQNEQHQTHAAM